MTELVLTAVGPDRPGLVDELSGALLGAGANVADSRMINLRGQFAMIVMIEVGESNDIDAVRRNLAAAGNDIGLSVTLAPHIAGLTRDDDDGAAPGQGVPYRLKTSAMDQPGMVHRITHELHSYGVNIEELQTRLQPGSYSGTPLFSMEMCMTVPGTVSIHKLREKVEKLCESLNCDVEIHSV